MRGDNVKVINISKKRFETLERLALSRDIMSTEAIIYHLDIRANWRTERKLLKKLYIDEGETFGNKLETINNLIFYRDIFEDERLVFPEQLVTVGKRLVGFTLPLIEGDNLSLVLSDRYTTTAEKIDYLKQVGETLEKLKCHRKYSPINDFYIGDLHPQNMVLDKDKKVHIVDLDSCSIAGNKPFPMRCFASNKITKTMPKKYPVLDYATKASEDTDLFAYNMMVLGTIAGTDVNRLSCEQYYEYLNYLYNIKVDRGLLDSFNKLYTYVPNENPLPYLEELNNVDPRANYTVFQKLKKY